MKSSLFTGLIFTVAVSLAMPGCSSNRKPFWFARHVDHNYCTCAVCESEINYGETADDVIESEIVEYDHSAEDGSAMPKKPDSAESPNAGSSGSSTKIIEQEGFFVASPEINEFSEESDAAEKESPSRNSGFKPVDTVELKDQKSDGTSQTYVSSEEQQKKIDSIKADAKRKSEQQLEAAKQEAKKILESAKAEAEKIKAEKLKAAQEEIKKIEAAKARLEAERIAAEKAALARAEEAARVAKEKELDKKAEGNLLLKKIREDAKSNLLQKPKSEPSKSDDSASFQFKTPAKTDLQTAPEDSQLDAVPQRVVLRAKHVQRRSVVQPVARKHGSSVPALAASFRRSQTSNALRAPEHVEASATIMAEPAAPEPVAIPDAVEPLQDDVIKSESPNRLTLRAVPPGADGLTGKLVQLRFKRLSKSNESRDWSHKNRNSEPASQQPNRVRSLQTELNMVETQEPGSRKPTPIERTASSNDADPVVVAPWRK